MRVAVLVACVLAACGDDSDVSVDAGGQDATRDAVVDTGLDAPDIDPDAGSDAGADVSTDVGMMSDSGPPVDDAIRFEDYFIFGGTLALDSTITDVQVLEETTLVELMYNDDARAGIEVWRVDEDDTELSLVMSSPSEAGADRVELAPDRYRLRFTTGADGRYVGIRWGSVPSLSDEYATFNAVTVDRAVELAAGEADTAVFTVQAGHRYIVRGNVGLNTVFVLRESDLETALAGETFTAFHQWGGAEDAASPTPRYLDLEPGQYAVLFGNETSEAGYSVLTIHEWRVR